MSEMSEISYRPEASSSQASPPSPVPAVFLFRFGHLNGHLDHRIMDRGCCERLGPGSAWVLGRGVRKYD